MNAWDRTEGVDSTLKPNVTTYTSASRKNQVLGKPHDIYPLLDRETTTAKSSTTTAEESEYSQYEDFGLLPTDWLVPGPPADNFCWNNTTSSANAAAASGDDLKYFQDIFQDLSNIQPDPSLQMQQPAPNIFSSGRELLSGLSLEKGEYTGKTTTSHEMETKSVALSEEFKQNKEERPKRSHAAELHNMSEKKRRNRIRGKLEVIQELIPNCNKTDQSSMLDDAIKYIKSLQLQVQMMSMGGGSVYHTPNLSLAGIPSTQMPQFMPYLPMGPGLGTSNAYEIGMGLGMRMGMGMANMCYTTGIQPMSVPSASAGLPPMSGPGVLPANIPQLQMQLPFLASQGIFTASNMGEPQFATDFCHALRRV